MGAQKHTIVYSNGEWMIIKYLNSNNLNSGLKDDIDTEHHQS